MSLSNEFYQNKVYWDSRVDDHIESRFYNMQEFRKGWNSLCKISKQGLGDIHGKKILHLQCHFGQDSISMSRMGAHVTGIDFSSKAIQAAKLIAEDLSVTTKFIESSVYDLPLHLEDTFDIVFTSYGALCWLPDLEEWAAIIRRYLKPNGRLVLIEFHPTLNMFNFSNKQLEYHYFNVKTYSEKVNDTYASNTQLKNLVENFWNHSIAETFQSLKKFNILVDDFNEYAYSPYNCFQNMVETKPGWYAMDIPLKIPHVFYLSAKNL